MKRFGLAGICAALLFSLLPAYAAAAEAPAVQRTATVSSTAQPAPGSAAAASTISCTLKIPNPHWSTHQPTSVDVVPTASCTAPMTSIQIEVSLYTGAGRLVGYNNKTNFGKAFYKLSAAANCVPGNYYGTANFTLTFPPGYTPSPQTIPLRSNTVFVACS